MHPGVLKAYPRRQGAVAKTDSQGKGNESMQGAGIVDKTVTEYREQVNDTSQSRIAGFVQRAATALSVLKSELIIEDIHGRKRLGESHEDGTNVVDSVPRLK